jgi:hypothetical protein
MVRHGDFCTANVVVRCGAVGVLDWEFPLEHRLPLFDLFYFFSSLRYPYLGLRRASSHFDSFVAVFWRDNHLNAALRAALGDACERYRIPREALADLLVLALVQLANLKYEGALDARGMRDPWEAREPSDAEKLAHWERLGVDGRDLPLAWIRGGAFETLRHVALHGPPRLDG